MGSAATWAGHSLPDEHCCTRNFKIKIHFERTDYLKRFFALLGVAFFILLYLSTFLVAFLPVPNKSAILQALLFSTFYITLFIAAFLAVYRILKKR